MLIQNTNKMAFLLSFVPHSEVPKNLFVLHIGSTNNYQEIACDCPWWYMAGRTWWKKENYLKGGGFLEYFARVDNKTEGVNFGHSVIISIHKERTLRISGD